MNNHVESFIASQTTLSRRAILQHIKDGRISVNGNKIDNLLTPIRPGKDIVKIDKQVVAYKVGALYYKFNKPKHVISTMEDPKNRPCLKDYLKDMPEQLFPIGRLDRNTTGLLLFTNDGHFSHRIAHPKFKLPKEYKVVVEKKLTKQDITRLITGIILEDGPVVFEKIDIISDVSLIATLSEGRNRIVRRAFEQLGYEIKKLKRITIGTLQLGSLKEGEFKKLSRKEVDHFKELLYSI